MTSVESYVRRFIDGFARRYGLGQQVSRRDEHLYMTPEGGGKPPFDVMLENSTQKAVAAFEIASRLEALGNGRDLEVCDIGTSKGTFFGLLAGRLLDRGYRGRIRFTLLEPDRDSVQALRIYAKAIPDMSQGRFTTDIVQGGWEEFQPGNYDAIIAAHVLYHFNPEQFPVLFNKMTDALNPNGRVFVIARERVGNQTLELIQYYKRLAGKAHFNELTIEDAIPAMQGHIVDQKQLYAKVFLPFASQPQDAQTLLSFFLDRQNWDAVPQVVRDDVMMRYGGADQELVQLDRLVVLA